MGPQHRVRFGSFEMDKSAGELSKDGTKVRLQEQPLQILQMLLERPGSVVTREELRKRVWPSDTFVDFDHGINNAVKRLREALGDTAETPRFIETLPRRGYRFVAPIDSTVEHARSLAVLPLENLSNDPEQEYFAEGLTEALITMLAKIGKLRVVSRTSCMQYKRVRRSLRDVARELGVDTVVEGTVLRSGGRVRVTAQLIDAAQESHLWAESYERPLRDVLDLQSEIAQSIAREVQIKLTPQEQAQFAVSRPVDPEAYEFQLKGRYHWNRRSGKGLELATRYFQQAIAKDPNYAAAYAGLADCANIAGWWGFVSPEEGCGKAKQLAQKALAMDEALPEAHHSLGWALLHYDFDFLGAERELRRAALDNPTNATNVEGYAVILGVLGRFDESITEIKRAARLDPLSAIIATVVCMLAWLDRRYDDVLEMGQRALELDPNFSLASWILAATLSQIGKHEAAIAQMEDVVRATGRLPLHLSMLGTCYAAAGQRDEARRILAELHELSRHRYISPYWSAIIYAGLNEKDEAFAWLETSYRQRSAWMPYTKHFPWLDNLHGDPRFDDLVSRLNYPPLH